MKRKNATRTALFHSILSLMLCVSMLVSTTFAWFTDSVTSGVNTIAAGNLDVELYHTDKDDKDEKVVATTKLFDDVTLWEPGVVAYENFVVANEGNLALKYQLSINFENETKVNGHGLSEALKVAVVENGFTGGRAEAQALTDLAPLSSFVLSGELEGSEKSNTYGIVIYWQPTDNDNVFNMCNREKNADGSAVEPLTIDLGVNLFATQEMYEEDSFGPDYDEDAVYTDFVVNNEEELKAALAEAKDHAVIGIKGNVTWTTGAGIGSTPFIEDATTYSLKAPVKTITLLGLDETATFTAIGDGVGAIGIDNGTVNFKNLKIVDESVSYAENSWEYGYLEFRGNTVFEDCNIVNAVMMEGDSATFNNCFFNSNKASEYAVWVSNGDASFEGCYFTGFRGVKVHEAYKSEVGNVVINDNQFMDLSEKPGLAIGTVNADTTVVLTNNMFAGTQAGDQGLYSYETDTEVTTFNFTDADNVVAGYADNNTDLPGQLQNNATVVLPKGEYTLPTLSGKENITIIGAADGSTVVGGENTTTGFGSNFGKDTTIQNVTFSGSSNGVRYSYAQGGTSTFDNCTFAGDSTYGFHIDQSNGATFIFNNCTFSGFNAFAGDLEKVVFNNCTFLHNGNYGHTNIWSVAEFKSCTFGDKASVSPAGSGKLFFDGVEESYHHEYVGSADSLFAFAKSVNEGNDSWTGQKVVLVADIDLENKAWTPIGQTGATTFAGSFDGQGHTISNLTIDSSAQTGAHYSSGLFGWIEFHGAKYTVIENVKIENATVTGNHNCGVLVGYGTGSIEIKNCEVTNATVTCNVANADANGDKAGVIIGNLTAEPKSKVTDCSASNCTVSAGRDAGQLVGAGNKENVTGTATNVTVTANGQGTGANINVALVGRDL